MQKQTKTFSVVVMYRIHSKLSCERESIARLASVTRLASRQSRNSDQLDRSVFRRADNSCTMSLIIHTTYDVRYCFSTVTDRIITVVCK